MITYSQHPINDLPATITIAGAIWGKIYEDQPGVVHLYFFDTEHMENHGFFRVCEVKQEVPVNWTESDPTQLQVRALREAITKLRAESEARVNDILREINKLLSITLDTKGR